MGPLAGTRIIELKSIGPGPYAGMLLADMGAEVVVVERSSRPTGIGIPAAQDVNSRGKQSVAIDLKNPEGLRVLMRLVEKADVLIEGYRPGVAERLGFGPEDCFGINPRLIYGRLTGWGQHGPLAQTAGHDINYISITGALAAIGGKDKPVPPLNLVGDYAGGSLFLVMGILAALMEVQKSGKGQVIDAAITDGSASLMSVYYGWSGTGFWNRHRQANLLDGAAYHYDAYETADGRFVSIGSLEPRFYALLVEKAQLDPEIFGKQASSAQWPELKEKLSEVFKSKSQKEWCAILEGTDVCFAPVLDFTEAPNHPHNRARETYITIDGLEQPAPAPRFSRTEAEVSDGPHAEGADTDSVLAGVGYSEDEIAQLRKSGALT